MEVGVLEVARLDVGGCVVGGVGGWSHLLYYRRSALPADFDLAEAPPRPKAPTGRTVGRP